MLNLAEETSPRWLTRALERMDLILLDHTHCEKKAAGAAIKLLFAYPHHRFLQEPLSELAREELKHFELMLGVLDERGIAYRSIPPSPYGARLHRRVRDREPERATDVLLVAALIEARSFERLKLLAAAVSDPRLARLLEELLPCEARHHKLYLQLAERLAGRAVARTRLRELALDEAAILREPSTLVRLHT